MMFRNTFRLLTVVSLGLVVAACGEQPLILLQDGGGDLSGADISGFKDFAVVPDAGGGGDGSGLPDFGGGDGGGSTHMPPKITMCPNANLPPLTTGTCEVTAGDAGKLFTATLLTPGEVLRGGQVLVDASGKITCAGCDCTAASGAATATKIVCPTGVLSPGLINTHDHITFQQAPGVDSGERYEQRHDWRKGIRGHTKLSGGGFASTAQIEVGELRHMFGGATSTVGSGGSTKLLRNLDKAEPAQEGLMQKSINFDTFPLGDSAGTQLTSGCAYPSIHTSASIAADDAYFPHIAEGIDTVARNEFLCTSSTANNGQDLAQPQSAFIHAIALQPADHALMAKDSVSLIWSPRSNIRLYGNTAAAPSAHRAGVLLTLGTDWLPSGSMNLLRELRCADDLNQKYFDRYFTDEELWMMVTYNAAVAGAVDDVVGRLVPGLFADLTVWNGAVHKDHRAILDAAPADVVLVLRAGKPLYGDVPVVSAIPASGSCDGLDVCGTMKSVCVSGEIGIGLTALMSAAGTPYPLFFCGAPTNEPSCLPRRSASVNGSTVYTGAITSSDKDGDGIDDSTDNCPAVFNPIRPVDNGKQADVDGDMVGDACDPCPLTPNSSNCAPVDPNDADADMIPNTLDNCPNTANMNQLDTDVDGKGDACDSCPMDKNPGTQGCPATIYDIKKGVTVKPGDVVQVKNVLVTGQAADGFFLQVKEGDAGYTGPANSGIFCSVPANTVKVGDRVTLLSATVNNYFGQIQLSKVTVMAGTSGEAAPLPIDKFNNVTLTAAELSAGGATAIALESVVVKLSNVVVTDDNPPLSNRDLSPSGEFTVDTVLRVDDYLGVIGAFPVKGETYTTLQGILDLRNDLYKLEPRDSGDLVLGPPRLVSLGPDGFIRVGDVDKNTIVTPMQLTLSRAATGVTMVTLVSSDTASLDVMSPVMIPAGTVTFPIQVTGKVRTTTPVTISATSNTVVVIGGVRVIDVTEAPALLDLTPATASVAAGGTVAMNVTLDLPAPAGGTMVTLSATSGTVPSTVTVLADQMTASFTYTQVGTGMSDTVIATLGTVSKMSTISIKSHLVINEVDYDQVGTDGAEFIELYNPTGVPIDLSNVTVVFINGASTILAEYSRVNLSGMLNPDGYLVIGAPTVMVALPATFIPFGLATNNIQNGSPDGVAVIDRVTGEIYDSLSYAGAITACKINGITGTRSLVEGTAATAKDSNTLPGALIRFPNGKDSDNADADWVFTATPTPGVANVKN